MSDRSAGEAHVSMKQILDALDSRGQLLRTSGEIPDAVTDIADDSRMVRQGTVFVAVRGTGGDGHNWLEAARNAGAAVAIVEDPAAATAAELPCAIVRDSRLSAPIAASAFFNWPGKSLRLLAVTGTNGKTTTVSMLRHLFDGYCGTAASIGTLGVLIGSAGRELPGGGGLTTPGPIELQRLLRQLADGGVNTVALEASSHALAQHRLDSLGFDAAIFTNLTRDHLDYHGGMPAYKAAKLSLLDLLNPDGVACPNLDDPEWATLQSPSRLCGFSLLHRADLQVADVSYGMAGSRFVLSHHGQDADVELPLIGDFNVANAAGAAAVACSLGMSLQEVAGKMKTLPQVPGRLERLSSAPLVLRDYAHTPDALEHILKAVRPFTVHPNGQIGNLIVLFGCGGDRDPGKRPIMGKIAEELADRVIVTSDNPRTEDPERIIDDIEAGMTNRKHLRIVDRRDAIARALSIAQATDVVILAGKGHETYQIRGTVKFPFDEKAIVGELIGSARLP